jgi:O-antigen ligase
MSALTALAEPVRKSDLRVVIGMPALICVLVVEGVAVTHSYVMAAPVVAVLIVAIAVDLPLVPVMATALAVRVLTDASVSTEGIRSTGELNLSALIALFFILLAIGLLLQRRQGVWAAVLAATWIGAATTIAAASHGLGLVTLREGVREASIVAVFMIVYNSRGVLSVAVVTRIVQLIGALSAIVALYQFTTHTGMLVGGELRAHGTLVHPDGAAVFFAIAATASFWRYFELGRRRSDLLLGAICSGGTIVTFSLAGLGGFLIMLAVLGALRPAPLHAKLQAAALAALILAAFVVTPLGSERIAEQTSTKLSTETQSTDTSLGWRFHTWGVLVREWHKDPVFGKGLGVAEHEGTAEQPSEVNVPHNEYLRYLVDTGIIGVLLLLIALVALIRTLLARIKTTGPPEAAARSSAAALALAILAGCLVDALASNTFSNTTNGYVIAMIVAAALSLPTATVPALPDPTEP